MYHGGIDMPAPWGTPIIAAASGTVVGLFRGARTYRGIEVVLRHCPEDTGLPFWIYTQYSHFSRMPKLKVGQRVEMGEVLGPTGNSGIGRSGKQSKRRRPAIHFGAFFSQSEKYAVIRDRVIPVDAQWMDPLALYRSKPPLNSKSVKMLPKAEKRVSIAVQYKDGEVSPSGARFIWPYRCSRRK
jgi:murein DD-endopeptidase MepM/ murein hydrolase activator NlpD